MTQELKLFTVIFIMAVAVVAVLVVAGVVHINVN